MKQLTDYIFRDIKRSMQRSGDKQIIRVDGFEDLRLYLRLCEQVFALCAKQGYTLVAKLSRNKYQQFVSCGLWPSEANVMKLNHWVDEDDHMTSYRNMLPEPGKKLVVLLLGTDMVDDKGGLNDFFAITPNKTDSEIGNKYSKLIGDELHETFEHQNIDELVDRFFGDLFSCVPKNLAQVSEVLDTWLDETPTLKEAMEDLFRLLPQWGIPIVVEEAQKLSLSRFLAAKGKNSLVVKASNFIRKKTYARITKSTLTNLQKKFAQYRGENGFQPGKYYMEYPAGQQITSIDDLEKATACFLMGDNNTLLCQQLIHTDFSILNDIINLKIATGSKKQTATKVTGMPLTVILETMLSNLTDDSQGIDEVTFLWRQAKLAGIPSNVEVNDATEKDALLLESWMDIAIFAGGVDNFICGENWTGADGTLVSLSMEPADFFSPLAGKHQIEAGVVAAGSGSIHKIEFRVEIKCGGTSIGHEDYVWYIDPTEAWLLAFRDLKHMPDEETSYLPYAVIPEMNSAFSLKDEDGFAYWITHNDIKQLTGQRSILNDMQRELQQADSEIELGRFYKLGTKFQIFRNQVLEKGFYASIHPSTSALFEEYIRLTDHMRSSPAYIGKFHSLVGKFAFFFTMCASDNPVKGSCIAKQVIVPPWHPATLEKMMDQMLFIRCGMHEWNESEATQRKKVTQQLDELCSLSSIHNATDAFLGIGNAFLTHTMSFGYYTLYGQPLSEGSFTSAQQIERKEAVFDDDFNDNEMEHMTREAHVLLRVMKQYVNTYPQAKSTLSVTFVNPDDLQIVVSALSKYVSELQKDEPELVIAIRLTVITSNNTQGARTYLAYWINHVFTLDDHLDIKAYLQVYNEEKEIPRLVPAITDIAFFFDAMNTQKNAGYHFYQSTVLEKMSDCRFPMVFRPSLKEKYGLQHSIVITQPQFCAATAHTQLLRVYQDKQQYAYQSALVQTSSADEKRGKIIGQVQSRVVWLCCIDSAMDKYTVRKLYAQDTGIIGFTTGEGSYGQMNIAITCRLDVISDMQRRCKRRLHTMIPGWTDMQLDCAANFCLKKAGQLDGVSILKAMNPNDYDMNNFLAYLIADELTQKKPNQLVILIRLDSYAHWFDDVKDSGKKIPDFLLLEASIDSDKPLHIAATVIEAKISNSIQMVNEHLPKAQEQVQQGIAVLKRHFDPDSHSVERRYWLAQLYRAIAFLQADVGFDEMVFQTLSQKLNEMMEGQFSIQWNGRILGCEIDNESGLTKTTIGADQRMMEHWQIGQYAIQNILLGNQVDAPVAYDAQATMQVETAAMEGGNEEWHDDDDEEAAFTESVSSSALSSFVSIQDTTTEVVESLQEVTGEKISSAVELPPPAIETLHDEGQSSIAQLEDVRVLIGQDHSNHRICWEFGHSQLANRHLLITGGSGQGKTYAIQTFLYELSRQNISSVVFDYTDGFLHGKLELPFEQALEGKIVQHYAIAGQLPINPFKRQALHIPGLPEGMQEQSAYVASRFAAIMKHVYKFGEQQFSALYQACKEGIDHFGDEMDFSKLRDALMAMSSTYSKTVLSKMQQLFDQNLFDTKNAFDWSEITRRDGKVTVIQLTSLDREIQTVITEMLMWDAWYSLVKSGDKTRPFVVVLDEAQNLSITDGSPAQKILQEGRKYGWSAWFATQFMKGALSSDEISRLQQAAETLYFKPSAEETSSVAAMLSDSTRSATDWNETLKQMQKGHCIVKGDRIRPNNTFGAAPAVLVKVSSFEERA